MRVVLYRDAFHSQGNHPDYEDYSTICPICHAVEMVIAEAVAAYPIARDAIETMRTYPPQSNKAVFRVPRPGEFASWIEFVSYNEKERVRIPVHCLRWEAE